MPYSQTFIDKVGSAPRTLGNQLGRWAIHRDLSVQKIARALGVTRQTVYNWFMGADVFVAYRDRVDSLLKILQTAKSADAAWSTICEEYNLTP